MSDSLDGAAPKVGTVFSPSIILTGVAIFLAAMGGVYALGSSENTEDPAEQIRLARAQPIRPPEPEQATLPPVAPVAAPAPVQQQATTDNTLERRFAPAVLFNQATGPSAEVVKQAQLNSQQEVVPQFKASYTDQVTSSHTIMTGRLIPATLISEVDSTLPGPIIAVVSQPVYGETGRVPLLPAGTRLYGRTNADVRTGEERVAAIWTRAIAQRADGSTMHITFVSAGTDQLATVGMDGYVDTHFWEIFGKSILLSVFAGGVSVIPDASRGADDINVAQESVVRGARNTSRAVLGSQVAIPPTVHVPHGSAINVIVQQDLVFEPEEVATTARPVIIQ